MYKNLNAEALGINGRQSEIIELALTHGFGGIDIDFDAFMALVDSRGLDQATRYLKSAQLKIGPLQLSLPLDAEDVRFVPALKDLPRRLEVAKELRAESCYVTVQSGSDQRPYHENFELHRKRIADICEALSQQQLRLGLDFVPTGERGDQYQFITSVDALITLVKTTHAQNLGLIVDLWKWRVGGGTLEQLQALDNSQIVAIRVADIPDGVDPASISSSQRVMPHEGSQYVWDAFAVLREKKYRGPVTMYPDSSQLEGGTRDQYVVASAELLDRLRSGEQRSASAETAEAAADEELATR